MEKIMRTLPLWGFILTVSTLVFSVGITYSELQNTIGDLKENYRLDSIAHSEITKIDKAIVAQEQNMAWIKEALNDIKSELKKRD